jgi:signal transduction histidine kinase
MSLVMPIIIALTFLANITIGLFVYFNNPKSWSNRLLALLALIFSLWTVSNYLALLPNSEATRIFWVRAVMVITSPMGLATFLMAFAFPNEKLIIQKKWLYISLSLALTTAFVSATPFVFESLTNLPNNNFTLKPGLGILFFAVNHIGLTVLGLIILYKKFRTSKGILKTQLLYFLLGNVLTLTLITLTNFVAVAFLGTIQYTFVGPTFTLFQVGFISYAMIKKRLLDIRFVVARSIAYILLVILLGFLYISATLMVSWFISNNETITVQSLISSTIIVLLIIFSYSRLLNLLKRITNNIFFRDKYDDKILLDSISKILASTFGLSEISQRVISLITGQMKISYGQVILIKDNKIIWTNYYGETPKNQGDFEQINKLTGYVIDFIPDRVLIFEDLPESEIKELMRSLEINILLPLTVEKLTVGVLCFGSKFSGEIYSQDDINVFKIIRSEVAVAIKNAQSYEEIKRFNITLEEQIKKATEDLQKANTQLMDLDKLKDEFVSLASHELRTPMTAIRGSLSTILEGYAGDLSKEAREFLTAASNENDRLLRLVNNLLNISRIEAGRFEFSVAPVSINQMIIEVVNNLQSSAKEKNLSLIFVPNSSIPVINTDGDKIREVLINLIGNAVKFTHQGGVTVSLEQKDGMIIASITDTGSGIALEDQEVLFKKFSQVRGSYAKTTGGTGLGLYICKIIIEGLKGKIWLESTLGKGSTFYFSLPIVS